MSSAFGAFDAFPVLALLALGILLSPREAAQAFRLLFPRCRELRLFPAGVNICDIRHYSRLLPEIPNAVAELATLLKAAMATSEAGQFPLFLDS